MESICYIYRGNWFSVSIKKHLLLIPVLCFLSLVQVRSQTADSTLLKAYPYSIGNVGFSVDSMEFVVGDINHGEIFEYSLGFINFGKKTVNFKGGRISRFVTLKYEPATLLPGQTGLIQIEFEVVKELPMGDIHAEIAVDSDDTDSPYKFLYLVGNIIEGKGQYGTGELILDTVPRMIFNEYNFDFGYLWKGKRFVHSFNFTNMGSQDLVIDKIASSDGISIIGTPKSVIPPGGYGSVVVKVNTYGDYGVQHRIISITSNDPVNPLITLGIHGTVKAQTPSRQNPDFCYE